MIKQNNLTINKPGGVEVSPAPWVSGKHVTLKINHLTYKRIFFDDIIYIQALRSYSQWVLKNGEQVTVSKPLKHFENLLKGSCINKAHRSFMLNNRYIVGIKKQRYPKVIMSNKAEIPINRAYLTKLLNALDN